MLAPLAHNRAERNHLLLGGTGSCDHFGEHEVKLSLVKRDFACKDWDGSPSPRVMSATEAELGIFRPTFRFDEKEEILHVSMMAIQRMAFDKGNDPSDVSEEAVYGRKLARELNDLKEQFEYAFGAIELRCHRMNYDGAPC